MNTPIHICILTTAHPIDDVRVNNKFAHVFRQSGFRVSWVGPGHAFFDKMNYNRDGIEFLLMPPLNCRLDRLQASRRVRMLATSVKNVDIYYVPDPDAVPVALSLAKRNGAKVIFDIHEVYHGALLDRWLMGWHLTVVREYVRRRISLVCSQCDLVIGVSDAVLSPYITHDTNHMVIRSCAPSWFADGPVADVCGDRRSNFTVMHGKGGLQRATIEVLNAVAEAVHKSTTLRIIIFTQGGSKNDPDIQKIKSRAHDLNIMQFLDLRKGVPMQEMPAVLRSCDVGVIAYRRDLGVDSLPNRLFEYMAIGLPIIAPIYAREIVKIIEAEKCGLLVDFEDPLNIANAIVELCQNPELCKQMGQRARESFLARHNWEVEVGPLLDKIRSWFPGRG